MTTTGDGLLAFYERAHRHRANRVVHHVAHALAAVGVVLLVPRPALGTALVLSAFPISWSGHYLFERNTPAFFEPPTHATRLGAVAHSARVALGGLLWSASCGWRACHRLTSG